MSHTIIDHIFPGSARAGAGRLCDSTRFSAVEPTIESSRGETAAKGVNWNEEKSLDQDKTRLFLSALKMTEMNRRYIQKNKPVPLISQLESEETPETTGVDTEDMKARIMSLLQKLCDGMQYAIVASQGTEWFIPITNGEHEPILDKAMDGWIEHVAADPKTPAHVLNQLASGINADVRIAIADNPSTPRDVLIMLTADENADVRYALAENHNISDQVLGILQDDDNPYVAERARRTIARLSGKQTVNLELERHPTPDQLVAM